MHINELQSIVRRLSNQSWVRWWANLGDRHENILMAIQVVDQESFEDENYMLSSNFVPARVDDLEKLGFQISDHGDYIYTIPRTNEDGTPFVSQLF